MRATIFFLMTVLCGTATASTLYNINFSKFNGAGPDASGSFSYDSVTGFSNFMVIWDGLTFDLTSSANAPTLGTANSCTGRTSNAAYGFFMMEQLTTGCGSPTSYDWGGNNTGLSATFQFLQFPPSGGFSGDTITNTQSVAPNNGIGNQGSFSITPQASSAPEPVSMALLGCGVSGLLLYRRRTDRNRVRSLTKTRSA